MGTWLTDAISSAADMCVVAGLESRKQKKIGAYIHIPSASRYKFLPTDENIQPMYRSILKVLHHVLFDSRC